MSDMYSGRGDGKSSFADRVPANRSQSKVYVNDDAATLYFQSPKQYDLRPDERETDVVHQWFAPFLSPYTFVSTIIDLAVGMMVVAIEDKLEWSLVSMSVFTFVSLYLTVLAVFQIQRLDEQHAAVRASMNIICESDKPISEAAVESRILARIFRSDNNGKMNLTAFASEFADASAQHITMTEKYQAYRNIITQVAANHNRILTSFLWWTTHLLGAIFVPSIDNDNKDTGDYGWLVSAILIDMVAWSAFGIWKQYEDVLRPTSIWVYGFMQRRHRTRTSVNRGSFISRLFS